ncbi:MAG: hypothetical protein WC007_08070 [Pelobacteraceae bacterium]
MKKMLLLITILMCVLLPARARAIDPGSASGSFTFDKDTIQLKYAYVHLHDNAEGWLDTAREMRVLVTDRQVPQESLAGLNAFSTLAEMLRQDKVRGVLLRFDPAAPNSIMISKIFPPKDPNESLTNMSLGYGDRSPIDNLQISDQRVSGAFKMHTAANEEMGWVLEDYALTFSAPLFKEPAITSDVTGNKALKSPQAGALLAKCAAMAKGDMKKARQYATDRSNLEVDTYLAQAGEEAKPMFQQMAVEQEKAVKKGPLRLVVRGNRATLIIGESDGKNLLEFVQQGGKWKTD